MTLDHKAILLQASVAIASGDIEVCP